MYWWENSFLSTKGGELWIGNRDATSLAKEHGTPLYVYSRLQIRSNLERLSHHFRQKTAHDVRICYALKANAHPGILKFLKGQKVWIDAVSPGEVDLALQVGFKPEHILFTGTSLSEEDIRHIFKKDRVIFNIDAFEQLELMKEIKEKEFSNKRIKVSVRWNPGIGRGFSPKTVTAGRLTDDGTPIKFGVEDSRVLPTFKRALEYGFQPVGLHQHLGSGWVKEDLHEVLEAVDRMIEMASQLEKEGIELEFLDFGGGFGPRYSKEQKPFSIDRYASFIGQRLKKRGIKIQAIVLEPGKFLVGDAGVLLLRVGYLKESYGNFFACVNAGTFNTAPRPAIYTQAYHHIVNCSRVFANKPIKITVAGNLCESGDVFAKNIEIPAPRRGDILALLCAGAYCRSMASNFNLREIPKEILI
jgi:diaminopimelate decarboxylase